MTDAPTLFGPSEANPTRYTTVTTHKRRVVPRARVTDPPTSHEAAASVPPLQVEAWIITEFLRLPGCSFTDDELVEALRLKSPWLHPPTIKTARSRLTKAGRLAADGEGLSSRGRRMTKWRLLA